MAGYHNSELWRRKYLKIHLLTIEEFLAGKKIETPQIRQVGATFKKAEKHVPSGACSMN